MRSNVKSKCKLFSCELCNFQTKLGSVLKTHKARIHKEESSFSCPFCDQKCKGKNELDEHKQVKHVRRTSLDCNICDLKAMEQSDFEVHQEKHKQDINFECANCGHKVEKKEELEEHEQTKHRKRTKEAFSPTSSPPRKKQEGTNQITDSDVHEEEVEMMDLQIEASDMIERMLKRRVEELENVVAKFEQKEIEYKSTQAQLYQQIKDLSAKQQKLDIPEHLTEVKQEHLKKLKGYRMRYKTIPNGACLQNAFAVHAYEDETEGPKVKRRLNNHVADNWWNYYKHKIPLPYIETVGVGENSKVVIKDTDEEMIEFLRGEDSLMVYSNYQELLGLANMFSIKIHIFTFTGNEERWSTVYPDPEFEVDMELKFGKWIPDMALYHCDETHYDLLVKDDSRLALLGLLAGAKEEIDDNEGWSTVADKKNGKNKVQKQQDKISTKEHLTDEQIFVRNKKEGNKRTSPQSDSQESEKGEKVFKCDECKVELESQGLLQAHITNHHTNDQKNECKLCEKVFTSQKELETHVIHDHVGSKGEEWNCYDCPFQASCASELINHLKLKGHQPSVHKEDKRKLYKDFKQCYTCKKKFDGYWNLMTHRKSEHPSNKKCRNFPGNCIRGNTCWWLHVEEMEVDPQPEVDNIKKKFECKMCDETFYEESNFVKHRKSKHIGSIEVCEKFLKKQCERDEVECWFLHQKGYNINKKDDKLGQHVPNIHEMSQEKVNENDQVFLKAPLDPLPPDQMSRMFWMISNLIRKVDGMDKKVDGMEKRFEEIMI